MEPETRVELLTCSLRVSCSNRLDPLLDRGCAGSAISESAHIEHTVEVANGHCPSRGCGRWGIIAGRVWTWRCRQATCGEGARGTMSCVRMLETAVLHAFAGWWSWGLATGTFIVAYGHCEGAAKSRGGSAWAG